MTATSRFNLKGYSGCFQARVPLRCFSLVCLCAHLSFTTIGLSSEYRGAERQYSRCERTVLKPQYCRCRGWRLHTSDPQALTHSFFNVLIISHRHRLLVRSGCPCGRDQGGAAWREGYEPGCHSDFVRSARRRTRKPALRQGGAQQNRRSRLLLTAVWSADLGFSLYFRNRLAEV